VKTFVHSAVYALIVILKWQGDFCLRVWLMGENNMKVVDLFCGCGGFSLGFDYLEDFELVYALDNWDVACKSYKANFPRVDVDCRDALEVKPQEIPNVDVIIGGPPCQEFSVAKASKRTYDMELVNWFLSIIEQVHPKFWIMENVPPIKPLLRNRYKKKIYKMHEYGVPQLRKRLFYGQYNEPKKEPCKIKFPTVCATEYRGPGSWRSNTGFKEARLSTVLRRKALQHECLVVQSFPLDYVVCGKMKDRLIQIGNAVPPLFAYRLAEALVNPTQKLLVGER